MTDEEIVKLYFARNEHAIKESENAYGRYCYSVAYGILRDRSDAEEIVNDTYKKAWDTIPPAHPNPLKGFLGRVTRQLALNRLAYNTAEKRATAFEGVLDELTECLSDGDEGRETCESVALTEVLNRFLRTLPDETRRIFIRRYWHMDSISELADRFSGSESKIKSTLARTRKKLKAFLEQEGFIV